MCAQTVPTFILRTFAALILAWTLAFPADLQATPLPVDPGCDDAIPLRPGDAWRDPGNPDGVVCFAIQVDGAARLLIELTPSPDASSYLDDIDHAPSKRRILHRTATSQIVAVPAGTHPVRVRSVDPRDALGPFRLRVGMTAHVPTRGEDDSEIELEPDPLRAGGCPTRGEDDSEIELEPDPVRAALGFGKGEEDSEIELEPDPATVLCQSAAGLEGPDDHGDSVVCGTPLAMGRSLAGEIGNDWGDDVDVFRFEIERLGPVVINAHFGAGATALSVFQIADRHGHVLAEARGADAVRLAPVLGEGTYFIRLRSLAGAIGDYRLEVEQGHELPR